MKRVCMIVPNRMVKGGIAAVVNGYRGSQLEKAIKELIAEKGISDNVKFPGWVRGDTKDKLLREEKP